jgi:hypothetical protein
MEWARAAWSCAGFRGLFRDGRSWPRPGRGCSRRRPQDERRRGAGSGVEALADRDGRTGSSDCSGCGRAAPARRAYARISTPRGRRRRADPDKPPGAGWRRPRGPHPLDVAGGTGIRSLGPRRTRRRKRRRGLRTRRGPRGGAGGHGGRHAWYDGRAGHRSGRRSSFGLGAYGRPADIHHVPGGPTYGRGRCSGSWRRRSGAGGSRCSGWRRRGRSRDCGLRRRGCRPWSGSRWSWSRPRRRRRSSRTGDSAWSGRPRRPGYRPRGDLRCGRWRRGARGGPYRLSKPVSALWRRPVFRRPAEAARSPSWSGPPR